ncbi:mitochondrial import inner membrane translocase subunit tim54 [Coemansia sp. RSA 989]|nr:inner membrane protein import complex subunit Tim54-domain-containing protein [Coemansia mojavensis]KAJ1743987.1 mitochondrial import inner membrane translocase subunit tim54 [Coemansia sp. RSA 1086]KAJ1753384.1 mitochondrial import inner membrane translocase subunit tim54 [Coemansia sp. RSA 1821]KAJ1867750.1 mitochondrial import inner membrane translocase subunit tim54 [Coemansia sp. RSA 989]KAJ2629246.1 mitochondrial import inner membrane translocase subunit tim54 [Coemansia sp. RSA 1290]
MFARIKAKLPGPKAAAFWVGATSLVGVYRYNKRESQKRLDYYCQRASHAANETMGSLDVPRKVHVYIAVPMGELGTRKARQHWEKYVLPVFAAGALDYELTLVNDIETENGVERVVRGGIHEQIANEIRERRRKHLEAQDSRELRLWREALETRKREEESRKLRKRLEEEPGMSVLELWRPQEYPHVMDIVAIGRETWVEAINGVSEGAVGSLNLQLPECEINYDRFGNAPVALPAVAYISHENLAGWASVPQRIFNFFHDQQNVDRYARQALQVVYESTKRKPRGVQELEEMGKQEEARWDQEPLEVVVDKRVADQIQIYDTMTDSAPF